MFSSLFGDLTPRRLPAATTPDGSSGDAAAGADPDQAQAQAQALGNAVSASSDVLVDDSPAAAMRAHFAAHRHDLQRASAMLTLLDPSRLWASQVLHALADAAGARVQRLNLRERSTLRTLAVIERTLVPRRGAPALRVYHADIRGGTSAAGFAPEEITSALAEGSQLTAVIVGAMQPHALVSQQRALVAACHQPEWRCPHLVFILPPGAAALRQRILAQDWPAHVMAHALAEPLGSAASVWNRVLEAWEATQAMPPAQARAPAAACKPPPSHATALRADAGQSAAALPTLLANRLLLPLARSEGLLACGIVDLHSGDLLASQQREQPAADLVALAEALCAARLAHQAVAGQEPAPDEMLVTIGQRQTLLRRLPGAADGRELGFVAVLDRAHANLALLRFKLLDAERLLAT